MFNRQQSPPGAALKKCPDCKQWKGANTYIYNNGKHDVCRQCRGKSKKREYIK